MKRIKKFGVIQTAKVAGLIYAIVSAIFLVPFGLFSMMFSFADFPIAGMGLGGFFFIMMPIFYGVIGFITVAIGCLIYNLISDKIGGIEVEVEDTPAPYTYGQNIQETTE
ncbi:hypothetical protein [Echinicola sp. 20G]|uniref:hypothetical protein n=1 Tax=Echinicola sp. 20G TaxID=2781961 RepID=UPI0019104EBA|nr:hypothetical protein [Echinicola sp. 20G]